MNIRTKSKLRPEVSTGSLNDIMFFLLLFFLIISTLVNPSVIKLTLPNSEQHHQVTKKRIELQVTKELQYYINNTPIPFSDLEAAIKIEVVKIDEPTIAVHMDKELSIQDLVDVLQIGNKLKIKMILATKPSNG